jgi:hypothetical protein
VHDKLEKVEAMTTMTKTAMNVALLLLTSLTVAMAEDSAAERKEVAPGLHVGDTLDEKNWQLAKDLLPSDLLKHYEKGEYRNVIVDYPADYGGWDKAWLEATARNAEALDVDADGTIIDKKTGAPPAYLYGFPFPNIDPSDPKAAVKIVWNHYLGFWYGGNSFNTTLMAMVSPNSVQREIVADGWFEFYDGQREADRHENPLNLQNRFLGVVTKPADLQGSSSLTWRYRDPKKRDSVWAYVPALHRVRSVSPANRSDGYLGSDISGDDGFGFDGKPQDFEWTLKGRMPLLRLVDPEALKKDPPSIQQLANGGWEILSMRNPPTVGFRTPGWSGISWAPSDGGRAKRDCWVIEAKPKDEYYLYGRIELWVDAITWDGTLNRKFSPRGELVGNYELMARVNHAYGSKQDPEWMPSATQEWLCAENIKANRASVSGMRAFPEAPHQRRQPIVKGLFDPDTLQRFGK